MKKVMKKLTVVMMAMSLCIALVACGEKEEASAPESVAVEASVASSEEAVVTEEAAAGEVSEAEQAVIDAYNTMVDRFNVSAETINTDENLLAVDTIVNTSNEVSDTINMISAELDKAEALDEASLTELSNFIDQCNLFLDELDAMISTYSGQTAITFPVTLVNNTGVEIHGIAMSPANEESWGGNILEDTLADATSGSTSMTVTAETLVWDLMVGDAEGNTLEFMGLDFSEADVETGATVTLYVEDGNYNAMIEPGTQN